MLTQIGRQQIGLQQVLALPEQRMGTAWRLLELVLPEQVKGLGC